LGIPGIDYLEKNDSLSVREKARVHSFGLNPFTLFDSLTPPESFFQKKWGDFSGKE